MPDSSRHKDPIKADRDRPDISITPPYSIPLEILNVKTPLKSPPHCFVWHSYGCMIFTSAPKSILLNEVLRGDTFVEGFSTRVRDRMIVHPMLKKMSDQDQVGPRVSEAPRPSRPKPALRATTSLLVFLLYIAGQLFGDLIFTILDIANAVFENGDLEEKLSQEMLRSPISPQSALAITLGSAFGLAIGVYFVRYSLKNNAPFGAACRIGDPKGLLASFRLGAGISFAYLLLSLFIFPPPKGSEINPLIEMGMQPGFGQFVWIALALVLAPPIEELLFRGILLGGFNRSFGLRWATALSTILFVSLHIPEGFYYWPSLIPIAVMSLVATAQRIRWQATGAAVAVHFGYNSVIVASVLLVAN